MIQPTIGRIVLYHVSTFGSNIAPSLCQPGTPGGPCAAMVVNVWSDRMVNLTVFDANGISHAETSVPLVQPEDDKPTHGGAWCEWMPYQVKKPFGTESGEKQAGTQVI